MLDYTLLTDAMGYAGATKAIDNVVNPKVQAERAQARADAEAQKQRLEQLQRTKPTEEDYQLQRDIQTQELQKIKAENKRLIGNNVKQMTFNALDRFLADNDTRHLNNMIQDMRRDGLPLGPLQNVMRVDTISANDVQLLQQAGYQDPQAVLASPDAKASIIRVTDSDGSVRLGSIDSMIAKTGYHRYAEARTLEMLQKRADIMYKLGRLQRPGQAAAKENLTEDEADAQRRYIAEGGDLEALAAKDPEAIKVYNKHYDAVKLQREKGSKSRYADEADRVVASIDKEAKTKYGKDFFDLDLSDDKIRRSFERDVERLESVAGLELDNADKKKLSYIKQLIAIGNKAGGLTDKETGLIDSFSNRVKKYLYDKVSGVEATSAYSAYANILRNALYGSVLTPAEMQKFNDQFGNLQQQTGPILVQFRTALEQLKGDLQSVLDTNNSYVTKFRIGKSQDELTNIVDGLSERINFLEQIQDGNVIDSLNVPDVLTPDVEAGLDAIASELM